MRARSSLPPTVPALFRLRAEETPGAVATYHRSPGGRWMPTTWGGLWTEIEQVAGALAGLGLGRGARLAILARTCREWQVAEVAAQRLGAVVVGIDAHAAPDQVAWILEHAGAEALLTDSPESLAKVRPEARRRLRGIVVLDEPDPAARDEARTWRDLVEGGRRGAVPGPLPMPDDTATIVYTSGTTGTAKGIAYRHRQLMLACQAIVDEFPDLGEGNRVLCWLPMAPLFQRMMNLAAGASHATTYFVEDPRTVMERVAEVRPTLFTSVPRFYEKLHDGINERVAALTGWQRRLAEAALRAGAERARGERAGRRTPPGLWLRHTILDRLVLRRIRAVMGGDIRWMISGSAPAPPWLLEFFHGIGLLVLEAYGLTENPVPIAANRPDAFRFGSVGRPFRMNEVRIAEDGEVLVRGPALFTGYLGEELPPAGLGPDGYYRTGDYGRLDGDGFLYLTGRKSELIKTSTGRRIAPTHVEGVYRQSPLIEQVVVVGNNRPYLAALIATNPSAIDATAGRPGSSPADSRAVEDLVRRDLEHYGQGLAEHERVRAFAILPEPLSVATGDLTTTLKPRRSRIEARHAGLIAGLYPAGRGAGRAGEPAAEPASR